MKKFALFIVIFSLLTFNAFAATQNTQKYKSFFNVEDTNKQFNEINKKLAVPGVKLADLVRYVQRLEILEDQAEVCIAKSDAQLKSLNELLNSTQLEHSLLIQQEEYKYLQDKKLFYARHLSECRFYVYRSKEALVGYKDTIQRLSAYKILKRGTPIWEILNKELWHSLANFDVQRIYETRGPGDVHFSQLIFGTILVVLGLAIAMFARSSLRLWVIKHRAASSGVSPLIAVFSEFIVPVTFLGVMSLVFGTVFSKMRPTTSLELASYTVLSFVLLFALSKYLFNPPGAAKSPLGLSSNLGRLFHKRVTGLLVWILLGHMLAILFRNQPFSPQLVDVIRTLYVTILSVLAVWVFWLCSELPFLKKMNHRTVLWIKVALSTLFFAAVLAEWLGYHQLTVFFATALLVTLVLSLVFVGSWCFIHVLYRVVDDDKYYVARAIRHFLGVKPHKTLGEFLLIKFMAYAVILAFFIVALMKIWGVSANITDWIVDSLTVGFAFAELKIIPMRIVAALISFAVILLVGRLIATITAKKEQFEDEEDTQVAIASIIIYLAFALASLFFLLVVGVNFTGLAIVAGALSVGIGLGLQNIVNNFVSGLILLLEKPIKPGDRVIVGNTEGFVKKIRLRSTQITTLAKEDVIVPNADLITNQVTNYMFRDRQWRVVCQVGVAYGSMVDLVKEVLLEVASTHPDVMQNVPNQPTVLFRNFGDSSLIFELWCIIHDVNKKFVIASDLHFKIDAAFRRHKITIAFPQRDLHVKEPVSIQQS